MSQSNYAVISQEQRRELVKDIYDNFGISVHQLAFITGYSHQQFANILSGTVTANLDDVSIHKLELFQQATAINNSLILLLGPHANASYNHTTIERGAISAMILRESEAILSGNQSINLINEIKYLLDNPAPRLKVADKPPEDSPPEDSPPDILILPDLRKAESISAALGDSLLGDAFRKGLVDYLIKIVIPTTQ